MIHGYSWSDSRIIGCGTLRELNISMENGPFVDDYQLKLVIFHSYVKLPEGKSNKKLNNWEHVGTCAVTYWIFIGDLLDIDGLFVQFIVITHTYTILFDGLLNININTCFVSLTSQVVCCSASVMLLMSQDCFSAFLT